MSTGSHLDAVRGNARTLLEAGDHAAARLVLEHAVEVAVGSIGEDHPEVLRTAHMLAGVHRECGSPEAARRVLEEALAAGQVRFGSADPLLLTISFDLGMVADELGNRHEARRNLTRVVEFGPRVLGEDHWAVREARAYLEEGGGGGPVGAEAREVAPAVEPRPVPPTPALGRDVQVPAPRYGPSTVAFAPRPAYAEVGRERRGRGAVVAAVTAAVVAVGAAVAAVVVLGQRGRVEAPAAGVSESAVAPMPTDLRPPGRLRVRDDGESITLSWRDPAAGTVQFIIAFGREGEQQRALASLPAGTTSYTANGLNPRLEYCFTVVAIYGADLLAPTRPVCTGRSEGSASPR